MAPRLRPWRLALLVWSLLAVPAIAGAEEALRVGTSGDYPPFSRRVDDDPPSWEGFDTAVARAYADDRGLEVVFVPFAWPSLLERLQEGAFDVAMSGITVRPERSAAGRFSHPVLETGAVVLVRDPDSLRDLDALDRPRIRLGVNAGGHLARVAEARFPSAMRIEIANNAGVRDALLAGSVDAAVTDTIEAPEWMRGAEGLVVRGPFTRDRKAYLVRADEPELAADLDAWLLAREADGSLAALRAEHFGDAASGATATPLLSLLAAVDERLVLMPIVGVAKRSEGLPLEVPEREGLVIDRGVAGVNAAAAKAEVEPPAEAAVRALYRALIEAAKEVQWAAIQDPDFERPASPPDVKLVLRPAILRIGEKIAQAVVALPDDLDPEAVRVAAKDALRAPRLSDGSRRAIADAIANASKSEPVAPAGPSVD